MSASAELDPKVLALRAAFDRSFAEAASGERPEQLDFLAISVAGTAYAVSLSDIQNLHVSRKLVRAPSQLPGLLGVTGFRGVLTPVYDLGQLLGHEAEPSSKWLVVVRSAAPVAFAFEAFNAHLRVTRDQLSAPESGSSALLRGAVRYGDSALALLHLPSLVEGIAQRIKTHRSP
ncbi:MAG TPA: chemotaxis protein CheW [Polyangiaceae bacterium]